MARLYLLLPLGVFACATPPAPAATPPAPPQTGEINCSRPSPLAPLQLTPQQYAESRYAPDARRLSDLSSTKERPVEVCSVRGEQEFLLPLMCADGTLAFEDSDAVVAARTGSIGGGGRCGHVIDHYRVVCSEATYDVYMDMYFCPEGQGLF